MENRRRERSKNFLDEEKEHLLEIISSKKLIIENKKTDGITCQKKNKAWAYVAERYNRNAKTGPRTVQQLKLLYDNLKKAVRKKISYEKTGDGFTHSYENIVANLLDPLMQPLENGCDGNLVQVLKQEQLSENDESQPGSSSPVSSPKEFESPKSLQKFSEYSFSSDVEHHNISPPPANKRSSVSLGMSARPKRKRFFKKVQERKSTNGCKCIFFQKEILEMKKEKHNKQIEILDIIKKKEIADLKLKNLEIQIKEKCLSSLP